MFYSRLRSLEFPGKKRDLNGESPTTDNTIATTTTIVMYNLNVNVNPSPTAGAAAGLLGVAAAEVTPRTPEIVNSLIAMTNPFEGYNSNEKSRDRTDSTSSGEPSPPSVQHTCSQLIKEGNVYIHVHTYIYIYIQGPQKVREL
ncbi:hypothetical protein EAI_04548 [Harpegnathos saltator]|uniref:Uncharacterized protein n=1 Tax=Harpegnathos saltator TaxID=610380 RepID=E2BBP4_HARSA|nr:hypothetical protein EAI_04548 [Harpegnathos saltator]